MNEDSVDWADAAEQGVLDAAIRLAPARGWNSGLVAAAAKAAGLSPGEAMLVLPNGARDLAALLSRRHDLAALTALATLDPTALRVRERISRAVLARLDAALADEAAVRCCAGFLALPSKAPLAFGLLWEGADQLWRWAGDTATDENHYSKRAILAGVLGSTLAIALAEGRASACDSLRRRIDEVMAFEKWKAGLKCPPLARSLAETMGKLRYGAR